jgi:hypothetical protein
MTNAMAFVNPDTYEFTAISETNHLTVLFNGIEINADIAPIIKSYGQEH